MQVKYPINTTANPSSEAALQELISKIRTESTGHYLISEGGGWHGGIHITEKSHPNHSFEPVRALACGQLVAYRITQDYQESTFQNKKLKYSNSFCLLRHQYQLPDSQNTFTFYSLYMHLRPLKHLPGLLYRLKSDRNTRNAANPANHSEAPKLLSSGTLIECLPDAVEQHPLGGSEYLFIKAREYKPTSDQPESSFWIALQQVNDQGYFERFFERINPLPWQACRSSETTAQSSSSQPEQWRTIGRRNIRRAPPPYDTNSPIITLDEGTLVEALPSEPINSSLGNKAYSFRKFKILEGAQQNQTAWMAFDERYFNHMGTPAAPLPEVEQQPEIQLNQLVILNSTLSISAGDALGYLGLHERLCRVGDGSTEHSYQIHLETFAIEPPPQVLFNTEDWRWMKKGEITDHEGNPQENNTFFKDLVTSLDDNNDDQLSSREVQNAYRNEGTAKSLEHLISHHASEWHDDANRKQYRSWELHLGQVRASINGKIERKAFYERLQDNLRHEKERLTELKWLDEAQCRLGLNKEVWHLHPIRLVSQMQKNSEFRFTREMLIASVPDSGWQLNDQDTEKLLNALNKYAGKYEVNTSLRAAHFLAQVAHESENFTRLTENINYTASRDDVQARLRNAPSEIRDSIIIEGERFARQPNYFNYIYRGEATTLGNGGYNSGDGFKYRGRGYIQLTGRYNYGKVNRYYLSFNRVDLRLLENPDQMNNNVNLSVEVSFVYWRFMGANGDSNLHADGGSDDMTIHKVGANINGWKPSASVSIPDLPNGHRDRLKRFKSVSSLLGL